MRVQHLEWSEPRPALLDHRVDAAVARLPFPTGGLDVTVLYDEPRALLLPRDHRLAGKESVSIDDIADEPLPRMLAPDWNAFWRVDPAQVVLATRAGDNNRLLAAFRRIAMTHLTA